MIPTRHEAPLRTGPSLIWTQSSMRLAKMRCRLTRAKAPTIGSSQLMAGHNRPLGGIGTSLNYFLSTRSSISRAARGGPGANRRWKDTVLGRPSLLAPFLRGKAEWRVVAYEKNPRPG